MGTISDKIMSAANLYGFLHKKSIINFLKTTAFFTFLNIALLLVNRIFELGLPYQIITRFWILVGVLSFVGHRFICGYLYEIEKSQTKSFSVNNKNPFEVMSFEALRIFSNTNLNSPNIAEILARTLKTRRSEFILNQMDVTAGKIKIIIDSTGSKSSSLEIILQLAYENYINSGSKFLSSADILWGFLKSNPSFQDFLLSVELEEDDLKNLVFWVDRLFERTFHPRSLTEKLKTKKPGLGQNLSSGYTNILDRFGSDLSFRSREEYSTEGRQNIISEIETVLTKSSKSNVILVGEAGVGKSTLVTGLANRLFWGESLPDLNYKRIVEVNLGSLVASARSQADLQTIFTGLMNDAVSAGNVILFIDNIHTIFSGGDKEGTIDVTEMIIPYLERTNVRIIGSTSQSAYQTYLASKQSVSGNFNKIVVPPTDRTQTIKVLLEIGLHFEAHYKISVKYSAVKEVIRLCEKLSSEKEMPGRAVDFFENICSSARNNGLLNLDRAVVDLLAEKTLNVPLAETKGEEKERLLNLEDSIHERVIGQAPAVSAVSDALRRARANVSESTRPIGSFLFLGPTGVGKTELAKALSEAYFGSETEMIRMDMNEFQSPDSAIRFIGKKITGREELEGGELVKKVRDKPFTLILLDEIEKANPEILNLFLALLDEGYLTDGMGQKVIFTNTIIVATSNGEANYIREGVSAGKSYLEVKEGVIERLQSSGLMKPEFLNRFDGVIVFEPLSLEQILEVAKLMFEKTVKDLKKKGYSIGLEDGLLERLAEEGYQPEMGARPMRRVFQDRLESFLAKKVLAGEIEKGKNFLVKISDLYRENNS